MPLALTFMAEFTSLTSFLLLISVMPMLAAAVAEMTDPGEMILAQRMRPLDRWRDS